MFFRQMLMSGASRRLFAPETDEGAEFDEPEDTLDEVEDEPDEDEGDEDLAEPEEAEDLDDAPVQQARQPSRADNRVREATRIAAEAKARTEALEREIVELRAQRNAPPQESQAQINERLAQMEPWERTEYLRQQDSARINATLQRIEFEAKDSADKTTYEALAAREPIAAKLRDEVESRLAALRKDNLTAPRETILKYLIGERALANKGRATSRASKNAAANRDRQVSRPSNGRGDTAASDARSGTAAARLKRLENLPI